MLCRAGCVPVLNDDQATGETDGKVVLQPPVAAGFRQLREVRQQPLAHEPSVSFGSWPSSPTTISRLIDARRPLLAAQSRARAARNGQISSEAMATTIVVKRTRNEDSSAKPAPGPMYASAGAGAPSTSADSASQSQRRSGLERSAGRTCQVLC